MCVFFSFSLVLLFMFQLTSSSLQGMGGNKKQKTKKKHALEFQTIFRDRTSERTNAPCQRVGAGSSLSLLGC